jgi:chromosome segregation ATPase
VAKLVRRARLKIGWPPGYAGSSPAPGIFVESLLSFAADLERRDAAVAAALDDVERLAREIDELRVDGTAVAAFLASLPTARAQNAGDERAARDERSRATAALAEAEGRVAAARRESDRLAAERAAQQLRDALQAADGRVAAARTAAAALEREADNAARDAEVFAERAASLPVRVRDVAAPAARLDGALEWASCARGAVLLERSALAAERELLAREASELLGSVLGEPLLATAVAGVRDRLERALASG